jgi:hypothetical protein
MNYGNYLNNTIQTIGGDLSRPSKFKIIMSLPERLKLDEVKQFPKKLDILAKNFTIPAIKNETIEIKYKGHNLPIIGRSNFEQIFTISFYLDEPQVLRSILDGWIRELDKDIFGKNKNKSYFNHKGNSEKFGNIIIESLNYDENSATRKFEFFNVYPVNVGGIAFSTDSPSNITEITVEFAYSHFKLLKGDFDLSNIFEDTVNSAMDSILNTIFPDQDSGEVRKSTAAVLDIFKQE